MVCKNIYVTIYRFDSVLELIDYMGSVYEICIKPSCYNCLMAFVCIAPLRSSIVLKGPFLLNFVDNLHFPFRFISLHHFRRDQLIRLLLHCYNNHVNSSYNIRRGMAGVQTYFYRLQRHLYLSSVETNAFWETGLVAEETFHFLDIFNR